MPLDLSLLNPQQKDAVLHDSGPILILAGAGTGKTRVITHRVARLIEQGVPADRILAVTFTNKAAAEMRRRIEELAPGQGALVWAYTFHSFACRLLRRHHALLKLPSHFTIYDQDDQKKVVTAAMKELGLEDQKAKAGMYLSIISRAKDDLLDAGSYAIYAQTSPDPSRRQAARVYEAYQKKLDASGALDFGDLLLKSCELLRLHESVRTYYQEYFRHLLVDEYQDTNHAQYILTKTLAAKHRNLCVVGDDDQSVYSWRGANIRNILEFERDFQETKVVTLEQNYRSTGLILQAASRVITRNTQRKAKTLWTTKQAGEPVQVEELPNERDEALWVTRRIQALSEQGERLNDIAVFYRTNAQSRSFEEALKYSRLPYRIVGAMRFYERKEVKDALAYARLAMNPSDGQALDRVINLPPRGIGPAAKEALAKHVQEKSLDWLEAFRSPDAIPGVSPAARRAARDFSGVIEGLRAQADLPPSQGLRWILEKSGYWEWLELESATDPEAAGRMDNLQELVNAAKEREELAMREGQTLTLSSYLEEIALQSGADSYDASKPAVTLMTVHLAKGLEFPAVFLTGLEEGLFPIGAGSTDKADLEEERRLCYVGMTRARERLFLTYAASRRLFGHVYANLPSRFILEAQLETVKRPVENGWTAPAQTPASGGSQAPARRAFSKGFRVGMRVSHPSFGRGILLEQSGSGETLKVTVRFDNGRTAKLLARYAPLEPA